MALFESYERRIKQIDAVLNSYGISSIEEAGKITVKELLVKKQLTCVGFKRVTLNQE